MPITEVCKFGLKIFKLSNCLGNLKIFMFDIYYCQNSSLNLQNLTNLQIQINL